MLKRIFGPMVEEVTREGRRKCHNSELYQNIIRTVTGQQK
jgi:hypothetical protein